MKEVKACVCCFLSNFYFSPSDSPSKTMKKCFFISSKNLFSFSRYSNFCIFVLPPFSLSAIALEGDSRKILKVYDVIICLNKNLITCFVWYLEKEIRCDIETFSIDRVLNTEHFYGKNHAENVYQKLAPDRFLILPNNPK